MRRPLAGPGAARPLCRVATGSQPNGGLDRCFAALSPLYFFGEIDLMQKLLATAIVSAFALIQAPAFAQDKSMEKKAEPAKAAPEAKKAEPAKAEAKKAEPAKAAAAAPAAKKEEQKKPKKGGC